MTFLAAKGLSGSPSGVARSRRGLSWRVVRIVDLLTQMELDEQGLDEGIIAPPQVARRPVSSSTSMLA